MYAIFGKRRDYLENMDAIEIRYLVLLLQMKAGIKEVEKICGIFKPGL
jgi:hypothetical protein